MGVGLFTKRSSKVNEVIFSERPLLVSPPGLTFLSPLQRGSAQVSWFVIQGDYATGLRAMTNIDAFMSLSNCHPNVPQVQGIASTNAFRTAIEEESLLEGKFRYSAVGRLASRINQRYVSMLLVFQVTNKMALCYCSCTPNIHISLDMIHPHVLSSGYRHARHQSRPTTLLLLYRSAKERRRQLLETYGFVCRCKACVNATPESDKLRKERTTGSKRLWMM